MEETMDGLALDKLCYVSSGAKNTPLSIHMQLIIVFFLV